MEALLNLGTCALAIAILLALKAWLGGPPPSHP